MLTWQQLRLRKELRQPVCALSLKFLCWQAVLQLQVLHEDLQAWPLMAAVCGKSREYDWLTSALLCGVRPSSLACVQMCSGSAG